MVSFALSGIDLEDDDAERVERMIAGVMTMEEVSTDILRRLGVATQKWQRNASLP